MFDLILSIYLIIWQGFRDLDSVKFYKCNYMTKSHLVVPETQNTCLLGG